MYFKRCDDGKIDVWPDGLPLLDEDKLNNQDRSNPGARKYWENLVSFDEAIREILIKTK